MNFLIILYLSALTIPCSAELSIFIYSFLTSGPHLSRLLALRAYVRDSQRFASTITVVVNPGRIVAA